MNPNTDTLSRLAHVIESRKPEQGGDPEKSYVARLLSRGPDAFLKKIGEEATEVVMAAKDLEALRARLAQHAQRGPSGANGTPASEGDERLLQAGRQSLVGEVADLWFHALVALSYFELSPEAVLEELARREGLSGLEEKALRKAQAREVSGE
jgi:phosphoribosyl-ATP pyrophosphohydrolase